MVSVMGFNGTTLGNFKAATDLSAKQYYAVEWTDTAYECDIATGASTTYGMLGILQNKPVAGEPCEIVVFGPTKAVCASTSAVAGSWMTRNASGQLVVTTEASLAVGWAMSTPDSGASSIVDVFMFPFVQWLTSNHA
jgi:hypothetical protein